MAEQSVEPLVRHGSAVARVPLATALVGVSAGAVLTGTTAALLGAEGGTRVLDLSPDALSAGAASLAALTAASLLLVRGARQGRAFLLLAGVALGIWGLGRVLHAAQILADPTAHARMSVPVAVLAWLATATLAAAFAAVPLRLTQARTGRRRAAAEAVLLAGSAVAAVRMLTSATTSREGGHAAELGGAVLESLGPVASLVLLCLASRYGLEALRDAGVRAGRAGLAAGLLLALTLYELWAGHYAEVLTGAASAAACVLLATSVTGRVPAGREGREQPVPVRPALWSAGSALGAATCTVCALVVTAFAARPDPYLVVVTAVLVGTLALVHALGAPPAAAGPGSSAGVPLLRAALQPRLDLGRDLDEAVAAGRLDVAYQPVVDVRSGRPVAAEALARWTHPRHGPIPPAEFVPLAEQRGSVCALGTLVLDQAVAAASEWRRAGHALPVSVNVSVPQLHDTSFPEVVTQTLARHGLPPSALVLEVTESVLATNVATARGTLERLRKLGVAIALDDFGTGYCSLSYLHTFPADVLKVDRALVAGAAGDPQRAVLLRAIAAMARALDLDATAEGAESHEEASLLDDLGFEYVQSFVYGRPMSPQEFHRWLAAQRAAA